VGGVLSAKTSVCPLFLALFSYQPRPAARLLWARKISPVA